MLYKVNKKGTNNKNKVKGAIESYKTLLKRTKKEGATKWMINAIAMATKKLDKYGVNIAKINEEFSFAVEEFKKSFKKEKKAPTKAAAKPAAKATPAKKTTTAKKAPAKKTTAKKAE